MNNEDIKRLAENRVKPITWDGVLDAFRNSGEIGVEASNAEMEAYARRRHNMIVYEGKLCTYEVVQSLSHTPTEDGIRVIIDDGKLYIIDTNRVKDI